MRVRIKAGVESSLDVKNELDVKDVKNEQGKGGEGVMHKCVGGQVIPMPISTDNQNPFARLNMV